jgi:hypothetical protein
MVRSLGFVLVINRFGWLERNPPTSRLPNTRLFHQSTRSPGGWATSVDIPQEDAIARL